MRQHDAVLRDPLLLAPPLQRSRVNVSVGPCMQWHPRESAGQLTSCSGVSLNLSVSPQLSCGRAKRRGRRGRGKGPRSRDRAGALLLLAYASRLMHVHMREWTCIPRWPGSWRLCRAPLLASRLLVLLLPGSAQAALPGAAGGHDGGDFCRRSSGASELSNPAAQESNRDSKS
jgi:hypothetical protein